MIGSGNFLITVCLPFLIKVNPPRIKKRSPTSVSSPFWPEFLSSSWPWGVAWTTPVAATATAWPLWLLPVTLLVRECSCCLSLERSYLSGGGSFSFTPASARAAQETPAALATRFSGAFCCLIPLIGAPCISLKEVGYLPGRTGRRCVAARRLRYFSFHPRYASFPL